MNGVVGGLIIFSSGMIGMYCDVNFKITNWKFYWILGLIGGFLATTVGFVL